MHGNADHHVEARVRIAAELAVHEDLYLDDNFLAKGIRDCTPRSTTYARFSDLYQHGINLSSTEIRRLFQEETMCVVKPGEHMGIWQIHAISSTLGARVKSVYPGTGNVTRDLHRLVVPRHMRVENILQITWTSVSSSEQSSWWQTNHLVPLLPTDLQTVTPVVIEEEQSVAEQEQLDEEQEEEQQSESGWVMKWMKSWFKQRESGLVVN